MTDVYLYPENYVEPAPAEPDTTTGRDVAVARAIIRNAVPEAGTPMEARDIVDLVCGRLANAADPTFVDVTVDRDLALQIARRDTPALARRNLKGPDACRSFTRDEVRNAVLAEIARRRASWTLQNG